MSRVCVKEPEECKEALKVQKGDKCSGCGGPLAIIGDEVGLEIYFHGDVHFPHFTRANGVAMSSIKTENDVLSFTTGAKWDGYNIHMIPLKHISEIIIDTRPRPYHHEKIRLRRAMQNEGSSTPVSPADLAKRVKELSQV